MTQRLSSLAKPERNAALYAAWLERRDCAAVARAFGVSRRTVQRAVARQGRTFAGGYGPPSKGTHRNPFLAGNPDAVSTDPFDFLDTEEAA